MTYRTNMRDRPFDRIAIRKAAGERQHPARGQARGGERQHDAPERPRAGGAERACDVGEPGTLGHATRIKNALEPYSGAGHYLNFAEHAIDTADSYGAFTYRRLEAVKARVDPDGVIHANHSL